MKRHLKINYFRPRKKLLHYKSMYDNINKKQNISLITKTCTFPCHILIQAKSTFFNLQLNL